MKKSLESIPLNSPEAMARVLALALPLQQGAAVDAALKLLDDLEAWTTLGMGRTAFAGMCHRLAPLAPDRIGAAGYLSLDDLALIDATLEKVRESAHRRRVARLLTAIITADGQVGGIERDLYEHVLLRWGLSHADVTRTILEEAASGIG